MFDNGGPPLPETIAQKISNALILAKRDDLAEQALRVVVPLQMLSGDERFFSFLAYPWPRLSYEQRCVIELQEFDPVTIDLECASIEVVLDDFCQINWFKIQNAPAWFSMLNDLIKSNLPRAK